MNAEIGIIGGSGLYSLMDKFEEVEMDTEYGKPSDRIAIGMIGNRSVAFLPRHGRKHSLPPHKIPYKANIAAFKQLGVSRIISTSAIGSLKQEYKPGDIALFDQFVNMTHGRDDTFFHGSSVTHVSTAEPYCPELRSIGMKAADTLKLDYHKDATIVVINGPRFNTKAESKMYANHGFDVINMTQYPEVPLAIEREMCYLGIGMVTDYDAGLEGNDNIKPVTLEEVNRIFAANISKVKSMINEIVPRVPEARIKCHCPDVLKNAVVGH
ncbi:MAG: S-methyl-5'-thioadenosine phosphorylase [Candidatus Micrarchaeota archaeon]|nr:S-methyl-5'-thioadenosine phosphorylase [Candidatus Micrarchaeota archaeon]